MNARKSLLAAAFTLAAAFASVPFAAETKNAAPAGITKEQAIEMALKAHPGTVTKSYKDKKNGKETWEVKIKGDDGRKWEVHYDIKTGELVAAEGN